MDQEEQQLVEVSQLPTAECVVYYVDKGKRHERLKKMARGSCGQRDM